VGEREITVGEVTEQINRLSPYIRRRWAAPEKRKEFLQKLIRIELLSQEAERQGLNDDPEVQRTVKQVMIRLMVKNDLEKELLPSSIEEEKLKAEYEKEHDKYHRPAQIRASQIVVASEDEAVKLIADLKEHADDRKYFRKQAKKLSVDADTKDRGGDLGYFSKPQERRDDEPEVPKNVAEAAWKLEKIGDLIATPLKSQRGFHVIKLTNKKPEMNRSFDSVKRLIENRMLREARRDMMDKFIEDLRAKAKIEIFDENLAKVEVMPDPPGMHSHGSPLSGDIPDPKKPGTKQGKAPRPGDQG
ncbi:MAG: peptidylprolyl isomerase, partial [Deltaproteobacteria bacterium]|nr:peptidylprolyl isomerase [Deltaproteobacteria bacterium]